MLAITSKLASEVDKLDKKNKKFGDTFLVINNPEEFLKRVDSALKNRSIDYDAGLVSYYDEHNFSGDLDIFKKPKKFEHQSEYRIFFDLGSNEPFKINIGSIEDISTIYEIEEFDKLILNLRQDGYPMLGIRQ